MDANGKDLVDFWNGAVKKGLINKDTAGGLRAACRAVLSSVEPNDWETLDLRTLDVEAFGQRFERLRMADFKPESLAVYQNRFKTAVASYLAFVDSPTTWSYPSGRGSRSAARRTDRGDGAPAARATVPRQRVSGNGQSTVAASLVEYPYPLRPDLLISLRLPADLTNSEAKRLAAFLEALAVESQLALPAPSE